MCFTADAVLARNKLSGLQHGHVHMGNALFKCCVFSCHGAFEIGLLLSGDVFLTTGHHHLHAIDHHLFGSRGNRHQTGRALAVHGLTWRCHRQACSQSGVSCQIHACRTGCEHGAHDHVFHFRAFNASTLHGLGNDVAQQTGRLGVVQRAFEGSAYAGAGGRHDDSFSHG